MPFGKKPTGIQHYSIFWNFYKFEISFKRKPYLSNFFDMMIVIAESEYQINIRKTSLLSNRPFKGKEQQTVIFVFT